MKHLMLTGLCAVSLLTACGGGGGDSGNSSEPLTSAQSAPLDEQYLGIWELALAPGEAFLSLGKNSMVLYTRDGCWEADPYIYESTEENSFVSGHLNGGERSESELELRGTDTLIVTEGALQLEFVKAGYLPSMAGCTSGNITVSLKLSEIPEQLKLNRSALGSYYVELDLGVAFEIDNNDSPSVTDFTVHLTHIKREATEEMATYSDINAYLWTHRYVTRTDSEDVVLSVIGYEGPTVTTVGNTLTLTLDKSDHPLLAWVNSSTPVQAQTYLSYPEPQVESVWSGATDGPWNWTSDRHTDRFPDDEFMPINWINSQTDAESDQEGESAWVDIISVNVQTN